MKKTKLLCTVFALVSILFALSLTAFAAESEELTYGDLTYVVLDDGTVKITKYNGDAEKYTVPSEIEGKTVTVIGRYAFSNCENLKTLKITGSVSEIEAQAIHFCQKLATVTIESDELKKLYNSSIENCSALETLNLSESVSSMGTLIGCTSLQKINIDSNNPYLKSIDGVVYSKDGKTLVKYPQGKKETLFVVSSSVEKIAALAFYEVGKNVEEIYIPKTVKTIEETAFAYAYPTVCYEGATAPSAFANVFSNMTVKYNYFLLGKTSKITATQTTASVTLKWNKVSGATGYRVYRKVDGEWKKVATLTGTSYKITDLKSGTKYSFAVKAYAKIDGKTVWAPEQTTINTATDPKATTKISATQTTSTITLSWNKVSGATGYRVYKYNPSTEKYEKIKTTTSRSCKVSSLKSGTTYKFRVRAYKKLSDGTILWGNYKTFTTATDPKKTTIKVTSSSKGKATVTWTDVKGETGYQVWYSVKENSGYKKIANYKGNSTKATKSSLTSGKTYYFKVRAYKKTDSGYIYSNWSSVKSVKIK